MRRAGVLSLIGIMSIAASVRAETIYAIAQESDPNALTVSGNEVLISFDSGAPSAVLSRVHLQTHSGAAVGMDVRPATGRLYLLTEAREPTVVLRLYLVDPPTGGLTLVGSPLDLQGAVDPATIEAGFDFDPVRDVAVVTVGAILAIDPDTGLQVPGTGAYFDPASPRIAGIAFDRNSAGASATTLFGLELSRAQLVRIGGVDGVPSPDAAAVTDLGSLGIGPNDASFDISRSGAAYAMFPQPGGGGGLYTVDLTTGHATLRGLIGDGQPVSVMAVVSAPALAEVPTLAAWSRALLVAVLALAALHLLARR